MSADPEKRPPGDHAKLAAAHVRVTETDAAVVAAVKARRAARGILDDIEMELAKHLRRNKELASERAGKLMGFITVLRKEGRRHGR
jgi:hypothetical protein